MLFINAPADTARTAATAQLLIWDRQGQRAITLPHPTDPRLTRSPEATTLSWSVAPPLQTP